MASKRMFAIEVIDSDKFIDLSFAAQSLYFHLNLGADDDGFVVNPRKIVKGIGCEVTVLDELEQAGFIISFKSGVYVIADWFVHNTIKGDRYHKTLFESEKAELMQDSAKRYIRLVPTWNQFGTSLEPQSSQGKPSQGKDSQGESSQEALAHASFPASVELVKSYAAELGTATDSAEKFFNYYQSRGWKIDGTPVHDWKALFKTWMSRERDYGKKDRSGTVPAAYDNLGGFESL